MWSCGDYSIRHVNQTLRKITGAETGTVCSNNFIFVNIILANMIYTPAKLGFSVNQWSR